MKRKRALGLVCAGLLFFAACGQAKPVSLPSVVTAAARTTTAATTTTSATTATATTTTTRPPTTTTAETAVVTTTRTTLPPTTVTAPITTTAPTTTPTTYRTTDAPPLPTARPPKPIEKRGPAETVRVVCVGDSITKNGYWKNNMGGALPETYVVEGFGVNGATALYFGMDNGDFKAYVDQPEYRKSLSAGADIVVIMLGTNDAKPINWEGDMHNPHQFIIDTTDLVRSYQQSASAPTVFLALPQKVIPALRRVAKVTDAHLIDVHAATANAAEHFADGVHPSDDDGRQCIADAIAAAIRTYRPSEKTEKTEKTEGTVCSE